MAGFYGLDFGTGTLSSQGLPMKTGTGGGGFGSLDALLAGAGGPVGAAASIASKIAAFFAGSGTRKRKKEIYTSLGQLAGQVGSMRGKLNPTNLTAIARAGAEPDIRKFGGELDKRYGFDSGKAGGEFSRSISEFLAKMYPEFAAQSANFDLETLIKQAQLKQAQGQYI